VYQLEREIAALRGQPQEKTVFVDDGKAADIEKELSQAFAQIQQLINTISIKWLFYPRNPSGREPQLPKAQR
jgi:hypothetical protein